MYDQGYVRRLSRQYADKATDKQFFNSIYMKQFLETLVNGVSKRYERPVTIKIISSSDEAAPLAYTTGNIVTINVSNSVIVKMKRPERFRAIIGHAIHETGHILFTDFVEMMRVRNTFMETGYFSSIPHRKDLYDLYLETIEPLKEKYDLIPSLFNIFDSIQQSVEDGYVDKRIISEIPGYGKDRVFCRKCLYDISPELNASGDEDSLQNMMNLIFYEAKFGKIKGSIKNPDLSKNFTEAKLYLDRAVSCQDSTERSKYVMDTFLLVFSLYLKDQLDTIKDLPEKSDSSGEISMEEDPKDGEKGMDGEEKSLSIGLDSETADTHDGEEKDHSSTGTSDGTEPDSPSKESGSRSLSPDDSSSEGSDSEGSDSGKTETDDKEDEDSSSSKTSEGSEDHSKTEENPEERARKIIWKLTEDADSIQKMEAESAPVGDSESVDKGSEKTPEGDSGKESPSPAAGADASDSAADRTREIEQILKKYGTEKAEEDIEKEIEKGINKDASDTKQSFISDAPYKVKRAAEVTDFYEEESYRKDLLPVSRHIAKALLEIFKDMQDGSKNRGLYAGRRFDAPAAYRRDGRRMFNRKAPEDEPDMAVCLIVDESGSTDGDTIEAERKTAYVVYDFCNKLSIPVAIYGHTEIFDEGTVVLNSYAEFDSVDGKDQRRILGMHAQDNNRDGFAIRFAAKRLQNRSEKVKLLMILSDGLPDAENYYGYDAIQDVRIAVKNAIKDGILVMTAGIGSMKDYIENVYIDGEHPNFSAKFIDIGDLNKMPRQLIKIIEKKLDVR